jgi:hypothetical protein
MGTVTNEMIGAAHDVTMKHGIVLSWEILRDIYLSMDALADHKKTSGSPSDSIPPCHEPSSQRNACVGPKKKGGLK